jgi:hypothetical protein
MISKKKAKPMLMESIGMPASERRIFFHSLEFFTNPTLSPITTVYMHSEPNSNALTNYQTLIDLHYI